MVSWVLSGHEWRNRWNEDCMEDGESLGKVSLEVCFLFFFGRKASGYDELA